MEKTIENFKTIIEEFYNENKYSDVCNFDNTAKEKLLEKIDGAFNNAPDEKGEA